MSIKTFEVYGPLNGVVYAVRFTEAAAKRAQRKWNGSLVRSVTAAELDDRTLLLDALKALIDVVTKLDDDRVIAAPPRAWFVARDLVEKIEGGK